MTDDARCPLHVAFALVDGVCPVCAARGKAVDSPEMKALIDELGERTTEAAAPFIEPKLDLQKNSYSFAISREMAVDMGLVEPSYEEKMRRYEWALTDRHDKTVARGLFDDAQQRIAALDAEANPIAVKVLGLHTPDVEHGLPPKCAGCPADGEYGAHGWPCSTVAAVCEHLGIELPLSDDIDDDYEPVHPDDQPPWEPFRIRDLFPNSFVGMDPITFGGGSDGE